MSRSVHVLLQLQDQIKNRFHFLHVACIGFFRMPWSCLPSRPPSQAGVSGLSCTAVALLSPDRSRASLSSGSSRASTKDVELETPEKPRRKVGRPTGTFGSHALRRRMAEQQDEKKSQALQEPKAAFFAARDTANQKRKREAAARSDDVAMVPLKKVKTSCLRPLGVLGQSIVKALEKSSSGARLVSLHHRQQPPPCLGVLGRFWLVILPFEPP